jgi:hypothetical protein
MRAALPVARKHIIARQSPDAAVAVAMDVAVPVIRSTRTQPGTRRRRADSPQHEDAERPGMPQHAGPSFPKPNQVCGHFGLLRRSVSGTGQHVCPVTTPNSGL